MKSCTFCQSLPNSLSAKGIKRELGFWVFGQVVGHQN
jgi:hypothetical protein